LRVSTVQDRTNGKQLGKAPEPDAATPTQQWRAASECITMHLSRTDESVTAVMALAECAFSRVPTSPDCASRERAHWSEGRTRAPRTPYCATQARACSAAIGNWHGSGRQPLGVAQAGACARQRSRTMAYGLITRRVEVPTCRAQNGKQQKAKPLTEKTRQRESSRTGETRQASHGARKAKDWRLRAGGPPEYRTDKQSRLALHRPALVRGSAPERWHTD